jgi:hypothetical protein
MHVDTESVEAFQQSGFAQRRRGAFLPRRVCAGAARCADNGETLGHVFTQRMKQPQRSQLHHHVFITKKMREREKSMNRASSSASRRAARLPSSVEVAAINVSRLSNQLSATPSKSSGGAPRLSRIRSSSGVPIVETLPGTFQVFVSCK